MTTRKGVCVYVCVCVCACARARVCSSGGGERDKGCEVDGERERKCARVCVYLRTWATRGANACTCDVSVHGPANTPTSACVHTRTYVYGSKKEVGLWGICKDRRGGLRLY